MFLLNRKICRVRAESLMLSVYKDSIKRMWNSILLSQIRADLIWISFVLNFLERCSWYKAAYSFLVFIVSTLISFRRNCRLITPNLYVIAILQLVIMSESYPIVESHSSTTIASTPWQLPWIKIKSFHLFLLLNDRVDSATTGAGYGGRLIVVLIVTLRWTAFFTTLLETIECQGCLCIKVFYGELSHNNANSL